MIPVSLAILHLLAVVAGVSFLAGVLWGFRPSTTGRAQRAMLLLSYGGAFVLGAQSTWSAAVNGLRWVSATLLAVALVVFWSAQLAHGQQRPGKAWGAEGPQALCLRGPYRFIRHPLYTAYMVAAVALLLHAAPCVRSVVIAVVCWQYFLCARREERTILDSPLGEKYAVYRRQTGMFLPRIFRSK